MLLVGQNGAGWTVASTSLVSSGGNSTYFASGYAAVATGTMTAAHFQAQSSNPIKGRVYVYSGEFPSDTLLAVSAEIDLSATGDRSAAISGAITAGAKYTLVFQFASSSVQGATNTGSNGFQCNQNTAAHVTYGSPPTNLPAADNSNGHEFVVWIEGTSSGGGSAAPVGMLLGMGT